VLSIENIRKKQRWLYKNMKLKMKLFLHRVAKILLNKIGYSLISKISEKKKLDFNRDFRQNLSLENQKIVSVVFSKDRAMQLHAFLESYFENVMNCSRIVVLYKASNKEHAKSYEQLKDIFINRNVNFIEEVSFRKQLIRIVSRLEEDRILFYADDMIFTHKFDYKLLDNVNPYTTIVSLSRGLDMIYSSVLLKDLKLPKFINVGKVLKQFHWSEIKETSDWSYPLGLSGYLYSTKEILSIFNNVDFKAPNSLEGAMQVFKSEFINRFGMCTENAISVCVHANLVQTEGVNPILNNFTIEDLLEKWKSGEEIARDSFYAKPINITQKQDYTFRERMKKRSNKKNN